MISEDKNFCIQRVTADDIDDIVQIENESFLYPWRRETFVSEIMNSFSRFFIVRHNGSAAGFIIYWDIPCEIHLINIAVRPLYRRNGIGTLMMNYMIDYGRISQKQIITLEVRVSNLGAISFYKRFNFSQLYIREKYYVDNDEDAIVMELRL